ncbi:hypothetical protein Tco_1395076 [Tanacetum coccineum]
MVSYVVIDRERARGAFGVSKTPIGAFGLTATATVVWAGGDGGWHDHQAWEVVVSDERSASSCEGMGRLSRFSIGDCIGRTAQVYRAGAANNTICEPEQNWE